MAETYKSLAQGQLANSSTDVYTVASLTKCVEPSVYVFNTGVATETVKIHLYDGTTSRQFKSVDVPASGSAVVTFDKLVMEATHKVRAETTTAATVNYWLSGVEIT